MAHVQPCDQGIIRTFKAHYCCCYFQQAIDLYDSGTTPSQTYNINQLKAMRIADEAWKAVDCTTRANCFHKASILPDSSNTAAVSEPVSLPITSLLNTSSDVEVELNETLDAFQATGALQRRNRMTIESLLNPDKEVNYMNGDSDLEGIHNAVIKSRDAQLLAAEINGGDDDVDDDAPVQPRPSRREALQAVSAIREFVRSMEDPYARKMEAILTSFGRQTRLEETQNMVDTQITDFFSSA
ncbi:hypothetical protein D9758_017656 [Tetrapyrgos nigripes]|uniref:DDE-1 domain-containing protein n=1 Tax=Tetrapyrgos nigripes TaxID=182062 RepID=A0A8H5CFJ7_9AGAR|nr:hypothetical protein D9758_017656 [Tetrapyrgos nigripes]